MLTEQEEVPIIVNTDDMPIRQIGFAILLIMFGIFGTWSALAPIDSSSLAVGSVAVKFHRKTVQHLEGGIVSQIHVRDGDAVKKGQTLITLDDTQLQAQIKILQGQFITATVVNARLNTERLHRKRIKFPNSLDNLNDNRVKAAITGQKQVFLARKESHSGEITLLEQRVEQLGLKIAGLETQIENKLLMLNSYAEEIKDLNELLAEGFADKQRLRELQRNHTQTNSDIASLKTEIASTQMQQGETDLQILQTKRKFQEDIATQLEEVNNELFSINEQLIVAQDKGSRGVITAPVQGIVLGMSTHTEGGVIVAGHPILDIVPEGEELIINAQLALVDIDRVQIGDIAEVRFSAFNSKTTPVMEGRIKQISADSLQDEVTGAQYYQATIELTQDSQGLLGDLILVPGMPAEVLINTGKRTLFEYLVQPITDAFARAFIEE